MSRIAEASVDFVCGVTATLTAGSKYSTDGNKGASTSATQVLLPARWYIDGQMRLTARVADARLEAHEEQLRAHEHQVHTLRVAMWVVLVASWSPCMSRGCKGTSCRSSIQTYAGTVLLDA